MTNGKPRSIMNDKQNDKDGMVDDKDGKPRSTMNDKQNDKDGMVDDKDKPHNEPPVLNIACSRVFVNACKKKKTSGTADVGLIGLGPMGKALALNLREKGYVVAVYNRTKERTDEFMHENGDDDMHADSVSENDSKNDDKTSDTNDNKNDNISKNNVKNGVDKTNDNENKDDSKNGYFIYTYDLQTLVGTVNRPAIIITIVKSAGTDSVLAHIAPLLTSTDYVLDFSNSTPDMTEARAGTFSFQYMGIGISGGTQGARSNGGIMVGGPATAYHDIQHVLSSLSTSVGYFGSGGAGHFVKMVHNSVEYALMSVIVEMASILRRMKRQALLRRWNEEMRMYLISALCTVMESAETARVDARVDMKGTGQWVLRECAGVSSTLLLNSAIEQRMGTCTGQSGNAGKCDGKTGRKRLGISRLLTLAQPSDSALKNALVFCLKQCYHEGIAVLRGSQQYAIDVPSVLRVWRHGCIVESALLDDLHISTDHLRDVKRVMAYAIGKNIRVATISNCYYKMVGSDEQLAWLACMRDYFGDHGVYVNGEKTNIAWKKG